MISLCIFCDESSFELSKIIPFLGLLVSIGTFILAVIAYRKFLLKQFREKQLAVVCDLIKKINDEYNWFAFKNIDPKPFITANLFDLAELPYENLQEINFYSIGEEDESRFLSRQNNPRKYQKFNEIVFWEFLRFHNHPLLPLSIALVLKKFNVSSPSIAGQKKHGEVEKEEKYVIMGRKFNIDENTPCVYYNNKRYWKDFIVLCVDLKQSINDWAKQYGIDDMNISPSHHFNPNSND